MGKYTKIAVKEVGKPLRIIETNKKYRGECVKDFIGQHELAEFVILHENDTLTLGVNESGLLLGLPTNFLLPMSDSCYPIQKMVGNVVFTRYKYVDIYAEEIWDYEITDLTNKDLIFIDRLVSEEYQSELMKTFKDY